MPLGSPDFDDEKSRSWAEEKDAQWEINGYGPWAFVIDDIFAGWGGLQKEGDDAEYSFYFDALIVPVIQKKSAE